MFNFGQANEQQIQAIKTTEGPVLITAGPGTGKTFTLVQRILYLIIEKGVNPSEIFIATFTEKAAKELITRITNAMNENNISAPINEMYIGTFHSICLRILKDNIEFSRLKRNFKLLDSFDQQYMVYRKYYPCFKNIEGFDEVFGREKVWDQCGDICGIVNKLHEELVDFDDLVSDSVSKISTIGRIAKEYRRMLDEENLLDFSTIQVDTYNMLLNNPEVLQKIKDQIKYIMVDEYQDTNYIQEQLIFLLSNENDNICVVGDDDQGLYRFRGATIRNILEFPERFSRHQCEIIPLTINYRSDPDIVDFYNTWMETTGSDRFNFKWDKYRLDKKIEAYKNKTIKSPAAVRLSSIYDEDEWHKKIKDFILQFKESDHFVDLNQIAFLFNSVRTEKATALAEYLEKEGIFVYSPRSDMFFDRDEIKTIIGCLLLMFPDYVSSMAHGEFNSLSDDYINYYVSCINEAKKHMNGPEGEKFKSWIANKGRIHTSLKGNLDYSFSGLIYQLFMFEPFKSILSVDLSQGVFDSRPARNLSTFSQIIGRYEYLHHINVFTEKFIKQNVLTLFNTFLRLQLTEGISEYEDEAEYAPSGCVSFMTIHQSKGLEFPIVVVDSLGNVPRSRNNYYLEEIEQKYYKKKAFEPADKIKYFDFWRLYYTAFSRAQDLLILTCNKNNKTPSPYFVRVYNMLPEIEGSSFDINEFEFDSVKDVNIKRSFSFTSDIVVFENCSLQYKFYKELGFYPVRASAQLFGRLVHETIEDIHKSAIKNEAEKITEENVTDWFNTNYENLSKAEHSYLAEPQKNAALKQILRYIERNKNNWDLIKHAEVDVSLVQDKYIIDGKIDLIKGENDTVELVDFKSERKPDLVLDQDRLEQYRRQLHVYAYLVENRHGYKVSKMNLYFTGEDSGIPTVSYNYTPTAISGTMESFDDTVQKIINREYHNQSNKQKTCDNCDFRYLCGKNKTI